MDLPAGFETDEVVRLETNLDDLSPEITAATTARLLAAGALDVWLTPILMKKGRAATMLSVLCAPEQVSALAELIFAETATLGLRIERVLRLKLERRFATVETPWGAVTVKQGLRHGQVQQSVPEYESCRQLSESAGVPLRLVYEAALRASGQT